MDPEVMMLEKAFAKLCGSYAATEAGITEPWLSSWCRRWSQEQPISSCYDDFWIFVISEGGEDSVAEVFVCANAAILIFLGT